jgi:hypothetical protein
MRSCEARAEVQRYDCPHCRQGFTATELPLHAPRCPLRPLRDDSSSSSSSVGFVGRQKLPRLSFSPASAAFSARRPATAGALPPPLSHLPSSSASSPSPAGPGRLPCSSCGRNFAFDRIAAHEHACGKARRKRPVFDAAAHRLSGVTDGGAAGVFGAGAGGRSGGGSGPASHRRQPRPTTASAAALYSSAPGGGDRSSPPVSSWRRQHEELVRSVRAARRGGPARGRLPGDDDDDDDGLLSSRRAHENDGRVACPHCWRRFAPQTAERHVPKCERTENRPAPPPLLRARPATAAATVAAGTSPYLRYSGAAAAAASTPGPAPQPQAWSAPGGGSPGRPQTASGAAAANPHHAPLAFAAAAAAADAAFEAVVRLAAAGSSSRPSRPALSPRAATADWSGRRPPPRTSVSGGASQQPGHPHHLLLLRPSTPTRLIPGGEFAPLPRGAVPGPAPFRDTELGPEAGSPGRRAGGGGWRGGVGGSSFGSKGGGGGDTQSNATSLANPLATSPWMVADHPVARGRGRDGGGRW